MAAPRSLWKGVLKFLLVSIPCKLYSASEPKAKISFKRLHGTCTGPTNNKIYCPQCAKDIEHADCVKGYEYGKGQYVTFTDAELDALAADDSNAIEISTITDEALPPRYIDGTMILVPETGGQQSFATVAAALNGRKAVGKIVMRDRSHLVCLTTDPEMPQAFMLYKLRAASQVRDIEAVGHQVLNVVPPANEVALATQLLNSLQGPFSFEDVTDDHAERVKQLLESKLTGTAPVIVTAPAAPKVASLQEALAESLKLAALKKVPAPKPAAAPAIPAPKPAKAALKTPKPTGKRRAS